MRFSCPGVGLIGTVPVPLPEISYANTRFKDAAGWSKTISPSLDTCGMCESESTESRDDRFQPGPEMVLSKN